MPSPGVITGRPGAGRNHGQAVFSIVLPAAGQGVAGVVLGLGRTIGEYSVIMMVAKSGPHAAVLLKVWYARPTLLLKWVAPLHRALNATAVVLFVFILLIGLAFSILKEGEIYNVAKMRATACSYIQRIRNGIWVAIMISISDEGCAPSLELFAWDTTRKTFIDTRPGEHDLDDSVVAFNYRAAGMFARLSCGIRQTAVTVVGAPDLGDSPASRCRFGLFRLLLFMARLGFGMSLQPALTLVTDPTARSAHNQEALVRARLLPRGQLCLGAGRLVTVFRVACLRPCRECWRA